MVESSVWNPIFIKSISLMVSQIHEYAYMSAKSKYVAMEVLKILPEVNLKPLDLLRMKLEEVGSSWSFKQMVSIYELFFLLKAKA